MKLYIKREKNNYKKIGDIEIKKQNFHQDKRPISIKNTDINQTVAFNKSLLVKKDLNISLATKMLKILELFEYFLWKWVHIEETLMKLNICFFW